MNLNISDPLFLLSAQTGLSVSELRAEAAKGNPDVQGPQKYMKTGEPIPIVFCRRTTTGGAMIFPKATEGNFSNDLVKERIEIDGVWTDTRLVETLNIKFLVVASEGQLGSLQVRDMFYGGCRRGTWNQTHNGRAGTWTAGNTIDDYIFSVVAPNAQGLYVVPSDPDLDDTYKISKSLYTVIERNATGTLQTTIIPYVDHAMPVFCGTSGSYSNLTTLSFEIELSPYADWNKQLSVFVRDGLQVTRLVDDTAGSSNNFVDLAKYLMTQSLKVPNDLIDDASLAIAANFTNANNFLFNGVIDNSQNLSDWLQKTSYNFLLRLTNTNGKFGLIPRLPYDTDHTIKTTKVTPKFEFREEHILPGGFSINYISLEDREPVCITAQWRQQPEANYGLVRTVDVRYKDEALSGPFVSIDLSQYCTTENHAIKVATYKIASRKYLTHYLRIQVRERSYNKDLAVGDLVRVRLRRETSEGEVEYHDFVYEITRIEKTFGSVINYDLTHFPIDSEGRSLVALAVNAATGAGNTISVGRSTLDCDTNSSTSTQVISTGSSTPTTAPDSEDTSSDIPEPTEEDSPYPDAIDNPIDPIDGAGPVATITGNTGAGWANPGDTLSLDVGCPNSKNTWYLRNPSTGSRTQVASGIGQTYTVTTANSESGNSLEYEGRCPNPAAPDGYDPPISGTMSLPSDPGDALAVSTDVFGCEGQVQWFREDKDTGVRTLTSTQTKPINGNYSLDITVDDIDHKIIAVGTCDGGSATDLGETRVIPTNTRVYTSRIRTSATGFSEHLTYQGPAIIVLGGRCINCNGQTVDCGDTCARPTFLITNRYTGNQPGSNTTCQATPGTAGFAFADGTVNSVGQPCCPLADPGEALPIVGGVQTLPSVESFELYRVDNCP
tara:strand:- start:2611 stop:5283 length:2673 start_codon:yes stop_codon:yes gene_type:complete